MQIGRWMIFLILAGVLIHPRFAYAQDSLPPEDLAKILRTLTLAYFPTPLLEKTDHWGHTKEVVVGIDWVGSGIRRKPQVRKAPRNDGVWRRLEVFADRPEQNLVLAVHGVEVPQAGKLRFETFVGLPVLLRYYQQNWRSGIRTLSTETRARCWVALKLQCEATTNLVPTKGLFPDLSFRLKVMTAELFYDRLVVEHTLGLGGDAARLIGDTVLDLLRQWKPSLERELLAKANAAIVKAGDTQEVRLSLTRLIQGQNPVSKPGK